GSPAGRECMWRYLGPARGHRRRYWRRFGRPARRADADRHSARRAGGWCRRRWRRRRHDAPLLGTFVLAKAIVFAALLIGLSACRDPGGQRAVTGGGIGAGSGAVVGALTPIGVLPGALVGGAVGAATTPRH